MAAIAACVIAFGIAAVAGGLREYNSRKTQILEDYVADHDKIVLTVKLVPKILPSRSVTKFRLQQFDKKTGWKDAGDFFVPNPKNPETKVTLKHLTPGTEYQLRVVPMDEEKMLEPSDVRRVQTALRPPLDSASDLKKQISSKEKLVSKDNNNTNFKRRILLLGPTGIGKSSSINDILSALLGRPCNVAFAAKDDQTLTKQLEDFGQADWSFLLMDSFGYESTERDFGLYIDRLPQILSGHFQKGYTLKPESMNPPVRCENPTTADRVHGAFLYFDIREAKHPKSIKHFLEIRNLLIKHGIPYVIILSMVDMVDGSLVAHPEQTYTSVRVLAQLEAFKSSIGSTDEKDIYLYFTKRFRLDSQAKANEVHEQLILTPLRDLLVQKLEHK